MKDDKPLFVDRSRSGGMLCFCCYARADRPIRPARRTLRSSTSFATVKSPFSIAERIARSNKFSFRDAEMLYKRN